MTSVRSIVHFMGIAAVLLPVIAPGESHVQTGGGSLTATAHLHFSIVIPDVLYLDTRTAGGLPAPAAVFSNGRNVALATTVAGVDTVRAHLILSGARKRGVLRQSACEAVVAPGRDPVPKLVVCTASTP